MHDHPLFIESFIATSHAARNGQHDEPFLLDVFTLRDERGHSHGRYFGVDTDARKAITEANCTIHHETIQEEYGIIAVNQRYIKALICNLRYLGGIAYGEVDLDGRWYAVCYEPLAIEWVIAFEIPPVAAPVEPPRLKLPIPQPPGTECPRCKYRYIIESECPHCITYTINLAEVVADSVKAVVFPNQAVTFYRANGYIAGIYNRQSPMLRDAERVAKSWPVAHVTEGRSEHYIAGEFPRWTPDGEYPAAVEQFESIVFNQSLIVPGDKPAPVKTKLEQALSMALATFQIAGRTWRDEYLLLVQQQGRGYRVDFWQHCAIVHSEYGDNLLPMAYQALEVVQWMQQGSKAGQEPTRSRWQDKPVQMQRVIQAFLDKADLDATIDRAARPGLRHVMRGGGRGMFWEFYGDEMDAPYLIPNHALMEIQQLIQRLRVAVRA